MKPLDAIKAIQSALDAAGFYDGAIDGIAGKKTHAAFDECVQSALTEAHSAAPREDSADGRAVKATSFADPADVAAFRRCKAAGGSDNFCFSKGDNGIGLWGDDTTADKPMCALPPEDWLEKWGSKTAARGQLVQVKHGEAAVVCELRDTMPHRANIKNGAGIDLNPAACRALGISVPAEAQVVWQWVA